MTRVSTPVADEPTPVGLVPSDGENLTDLLETTNEVRVESTAPAFGSAGVRIRGFPGQYAPILVDGLPLVGVQAGELSLVQLPTLDVSQVEIIEGVATPLYGPGALGGVVNLVTRRPDHARDLVLSQTSQGGTEGTGFFSQRLSEAWGVSLFGGVHHQNAKDVNLDGWVDVPGVRRVELRPRLFWSTPGGASLLVTIGGLSEARAGGTLPGVTLMNGRPFPTAANTNRADGGLVGVVPIAGRDRLTLRASQTSEWSRQDLGLGTPASTQHGLHETSFTEATLTIARRRVTWLVGTGFERDAFHSPELVGFQYSFNDPSLFAHALIHIASRITLSATGRCDWHSQYGRLCGPGAAVLVRGPGAWTVRLVGATGFFAPTPFIDETEGIALARIVPFTSRTIAVCSPALCAPDSNGVLRTTRPYQIQAAEGRSAALDVARRTGPWRVGATLFGSTLEHPLILSELNPFDERPQLINAPAPTHTVGLDLNAGYGRPWLSVRCGYVYLHSTRFSPVSGQPVDAELTPRHSGTIDMTWRSVRTKASLAVHLSYTGQQSVLDDPYRSTTPAYLVAGLRASKRVVGMDLYVNAENIGSVRQTQYDPLLTSSPSEDLSWTTEVWAPLEGRVISIGMRVAL